MPDLPHLAARLFGRPQCVSRAKLDLVLPLIVPRFLGQERRVPRAENPAQPTQPTVTVPGRIAIVPVFGTLVARGAGMVAESGQTSYEGLSALLSRQVARAEVAGILLDIDSGGGEFAGLPEFADEVAAANRQKPVWAIVRPAAFSAAYWIASQAERIVATPSSELGSIGVMAVHVDASARDEKEGYRLTFFSAGTHKLDGHPHLPLQPAFAETIQAAVDEAYDLFVAQVARGRAGAMTETEVRATEARVYSAAEGLALGLADQVGTFADAVSAFADRLASGNPPRRGKAARNRKESAMTDTNKPADPAPVPQPAAPPAAAGNVVALDAARREGETQALAYVAEVNEICAIARVPEKAAGFIAARTPAAEVRKALLNALAAQADATAISGQHAAVPAPPAGPAAALDTAAIYARRQKAAAQ